MEVPNSDEISETIGRYAFEPDKQSDGARRGWAGDLGAFHYRIWWRDHNPVVVAIAAGIAVVPGRNHKTLAVLLRLSSQADAVHAAHFAVSPSPHRPSP